jgi:NAD-dependent SIR2 family protein deacetylase
MQNHTDVYHQAAQAIRSGSLLLIGAGAGMSADSGLAVYAQASTGEFFDKHPHLSYRDLASTDLLATDPERYYAWVALSIDQYRHSQPHDGYYTLRRWCERWYTDSDAAQALAMRCHTSPMKQLPALHGDSEPQPQGYYVFTTNVDGFFERAQFAAHSVTQTHGSYWRWQCAGQRRSPDLPAFVRFEKPCTSTTWTAPQDYRMQYSASEMLAPKPTCTTTAISGFETNHPRCASCGLAARPWIYHFGDTCFLADQRQEAQLANWCDAAEREIRQHPTRKLVMLELGVGIRIPKIRVHFERIAQRNPESYVQCCTPGDRQMHRIVHIV